VFAQRLHPIALGGMVPRRDEGDAGFLCNMHVLLGNLAGKESVHAKFDSLHEITLRRTGTPCNAAYGLFRISDHQWHTLQRSFNAAGKLLQGLRCCQLAVAGEILVAEPAALDKTQPAGELRVVAKFGMRIQRQVVGQQADIVPQQVRNAAFLDAGDRRILAAPEIAMMHQHRIRAPGSGRVQQALRSSDTAGDLAHLGSPLHLHAVGAVIAKAVCLQQACDIITQLIEHHKYPCWGSGLN
jgi:hypothetical protein